MKIKIIASKMDKEDSSYATISHMVGQTFTVIDEDETSYYIEPRQPTWAKSYEIRKDEAEVIKEEED